MCKKNNFYVFVPSDLDLLSFRRQTQTDKQIWTDSVTLNATS